MPRAPRRSRRYWPAGPGYVPATARDWPAGAQEPLRRNDVITLLSEEVTLEAGHPLRKAPCLVCWQAAGPAPLLIAFLIDLGYPANVHGQPQRACYLIHTRCEPKDSLELYNRAHRVTCANCTHLGRIPP